MVSTIFSARTRNRKLEIHMDGNGVYKACHGGNTFIEPASFRLPGTFTMVDV
jgi:hypothetical protein